MYRILGATILLFVLSCDMWHHPAGTMLSVVYIWREGSKQEGFNHFHIPLCVYVIIKEESLSIYTPPRAATPAHAVTH